MADSPQKSTNLHSDELNGVNMDGITVQSIGDPNGKFSSFKTLSGAANDVVDGIDGDELGFVNGDSDVVHSFEVDTEVLCTVDAIQPLNQF